MAGRPTSYDPSFCEKVIALGKTGASKHEMAMELDISRASFDNYEKQHPEFLEAVKEAVSLSQAWWEKKGREATFGGIPNYNATSFIFNMKNRFKDDWSDMTKTDITSKGEKVSIAAILSEIDGRTSSIPTTEE